MKLFSARNCTWEDALSKCTWEIRKWIESQENVSQLTSLGVFKFPSFAKILQLRRKWLFLRAWRRKFRPRFLIYSLPKIFHNTSSHWKIITFFLAHRHYPKFIAMVIFNYENQNDFYEIFSFFKNMQYRKYLALTFLKFINI